ncbi:MAG: heme-binding protein [Coraliomargaritaceae bacterium]
MTHATEQAFPKTEVGVIEVKVLPEATLAACSGEAGYFERSDSLFGPLFRYIQTNDIAMTTPVEAEVQPGVMYFYIGGDAADRELPETNEVKIHQLPERMVLSIGLLGGYSAENFAKGEARLREWIAGQTNYKVTGAARAIYWNGPFTLPVLKRSEVHIPVAAVE